VTKGGKDPLLSAEENCAEPVGMPNALEVNHAFTRKMSHLFCVVSANLLTLVWTALESCFSNSDFSDEKPTVLDFYKNKRRREHNRSADG
jgi:hypothetical protein